MIFSSHLPNFPRKRENHEQFGFKVKKQRVKKRLKEFDEKGVIFEK